MLLAPGSWKEKEKKTKLLSVIKEKLMVDLTLPLAQANTRGEEGVPCLCR